MKYHLLSIGISIHQKPEANLQYASKDAADFFTLFTENVSNIGYSKLLTDNEATLSAIRTALGSDLQNQVGSEDCFVLFYSGHGAIAHDPEDSSSFSHFLVPFDVTEDISNSCIPVDYIRDTFRKLNSKAKLFFVDSCFSGAINSKSYGPSYKTIENLKTITGEISGEGTIVFTASKTEEKSIEDPILQNGIFTSFLLKELQEKIHGIKFSITDIITPITEKVIEYTKTQHHFKQTPTFTGELSGVFYLPAFKKPLRVEPNVIDIPKSQNKVESIPMVAHIELSNDKQNEILSRTIEFILSSAKGTRQAKIESERFILSVGGNVIKKWEEKLSNTNARDTKSIPDLIAQLEGESYQFFVVSAVIGMYGNGHQTKLVGEICGELLKSSRNKSGLTSLINIPQVVVLIVEYLFALTALVSKDFSRLKELLNCRIYGLLYNDQPPTILSQYQVHFVEALTGRADKVADHIRKITAEMQWLNGLHPRFEGIALEDLTIQCNFILTLLTTHNGYRAFPDFGRMYESRISPIIQRLIYDKEFASAFANLFNIEDNELRKVLRGHVIGMISRGLGNYWWNSISGDDFLTREELAELKK